MSLPSAGLFFKKRVYDRGNLGGESSHGENCGLDWRRAGDGAETGRGFVDGRTAIMTEDDHLLVGGVKQLVLRREK